MHIGGADFITYKICRRCKKMFEKVENNNALYCQICLEKNNKDYDLIIDYIKESPGATVMEIITATGATLKSINCFIDDGSMSYIGSPDGQTIDIPQKVDTNKGKFHTRRR